VSTKRGHGEGTIFRRTIAGKKAGWMAMLDMGIVDGKRKRKAFYGDDEKTVRAKLRAAQHLHDNGRLAKAGRLTVGDWLSRWLADSAKPNTRPATFRRYAQLVDQYLVPSLGRIPLERLAPSDVRAMLNAKSDSLSPRSLHHLRAVLRTALHVAMRDELIPTNAAALAAAPRVPETDYHFLGEKDAGDVRRFVDAIKGNRLEALYVLALALGLRQGELLGLRWEAIDLEASTLAVRHALQRIDGAYVLVEPKTKKSRRVISPLPDVVTAALREHKGRHDGERDALGSRWLNTQGLVFTTAFGAPLSGSVVTHDFQDLLERAGLARIRFHDLRHSAISLLGEQGVQPRMVMELVGHSNIGTTMNIYSHVVRSLRKEAAAAADRAFSGEPVRGVDGL
jgi:integrase